MRKLVAAGHPKLGSRWIVKPLPLIVMLVVMAGRPLSPSELVLLSAAVRVTSPWSSMTSAPLAAAQSPAGESALAALIAFTRVQLLAMPPPTWIVFASAPRTQAERTMASVTSTSVASGITHSFLAPVVKSRRRPVGGVVISGHTRGDRLPSL